MTATTVPAGLKVLVTYEGQASPPVLPGVYAITATVDEPGYQGTASGSLVIHKIPQNITWSEPLPDRIYGDPPFVLSASGGASGNPVTFLTQVGSAGCTSSGISGTTITMLAATGPGQQCRIVASQAGSAIYEAAPSVTRSFSIAKSTATIGFATLTHVYDGSPKQAGVFTAPPVGGFMPVFYNGSTTAPSAAGTYNLVASLNHPNYAAENAVGTMTINNPPPHATGLDPTSAVAGSANAALSVTGTGFVPSSVVRWNGIDVETTYVSANELTALVPQEYVAAASTAELTVSSPEPGGGASTAVPFFVTEAVTSVEAIDVASGDAAGGMVVAEIDGVVKAQATGTGTVAVAQFADNPVSAPAFISGGRYVDVYLAAGHAFSSAVITLCGTGDLAYWWDGSNWLLASHQSYDAAARCVIITVDQNTAPRLFDLHGTPFTTGSRANQTIQFSAPVSKTYGDPEFGLTATATSSLAVSFAASGACRVSGTTVTIIGAGACSITASQSGNERFLPAQPVIQTVQIARATPAFSGLVSTTVTFGTSVTLGGILRAANVVPTGSTVAIVLNGVTQHAPVQANGSFSVGFNSAILPVGSYPISYGYTGNADFNGASGAATLTVAPPVSGFTFNGFFHPVANDSLNAVKAGQAIPVRFSLGGNHGLSIFAGGYPATQPIGCDLSGGTSQVTETTNAGNSNLSYDAATDTYTFVWKTEKGWSHSCGELLLRFTDGTTKSAEFRFTK